ncbi:MAG: hypothetical protein LBM97_00650 [Candidatus Nomurabacteria bacterium]|jgi:predicted DNA-binding protein (MmcQ/YjbR family)|nr:hypothetical protein [Candidatus Nomurabacteria bacterium]
MLSNLSEQKITDFLMQTAARNNFNLSVHKEIVDEKVLVLWRVAANEENKNFLVIHKNTDPLRIDVLCKGTLSKILREQYESVMLSKTMSPKNWVEIICAGQISSEELLDLIRAGIEIASE